MSFSSHFLDYCLFVSFFPQLVAGPIVHHAEMMPQFANKENQTINWENIYFALILLCIGLAKKVLIADNLSPVVSYCFDISTSLSFSAALLGSLCYTFQLYFDFSAYSDMAIACGLFFNIKLPQNFSSPYLATSIKDFWQRWHITLSRWLRTYIYIPLGGNRAGIFLQVRNILITFVIAGLWHGASWLFVLWGSLHALALSTQTLFNYYTMQIKNKYFAWFLTFLFVNFTWIIFRSTDTVTLIKFYNAFTLQTTFFMQDFEWQNILLDTFFTKTKFRQFLFIICIIVLLPKNSMDIFTKLKPNIVTFGIVLLIYVLCIALISLPDIQTEFLYFQF